MITPTIYLHNLSPYLLNDSDYIPSCNRKTTKHIVSYIISHVTVREFLCLLPNKYNN